MRQPIPCKTKTAYLVLLIILTITKSTVKSIKKKKVYNEGKLPIAPLRLTDYIVLLNLVY